jgi:hypothetical protein
MNVNDEYAVIVRSRTITKQKADARKAEAAKAAEAKKAETPAEQK